MRPRPAIAAGVVLLAMATRPLPAAADPAEALALAQALRLPPGALARVEAHARTLQAQGPGAAAAPKAKDPHAACALFASADALRAALFDGLAPRLAEGDRAERQMARELLAGLVRALPGVGVRLPADPDAPFEAGVDHAALAAVLPAGAPGRALLAAAGGLRLPAGPPAYLRPAMPPFPGACADFGRVLGPLGRLPGAWTAAPACLRTRLGPGLREAIVKMGEQADFCRDEPAARAHAREAARLLGSLPAFGGPGTGKRIGHNFRSYGLRFDLAP